METYRFRVVVFREDDWWVAQCLEHDLATNARSLSDLVYEVERALVSQIAVNAGSDVDPFAGIPKAPRKYWKMFEEATVELTPRGHADQHFPVPEGGSRPTFQLKAAA